MRPTIYRGALFHVDNELFNWARPPRWVESEVAREGHAVVVVSGDEQNFDKSWATVLIAPISKQVSWTSPFDVELLPATDNVAVRCWAMATLIQPINKSHLVEVYQSSWQNLKQTAAVSAIKQEEIKARLIQYLDLLV